MKKTETCKYCGAELMNDWISLNRKLIKPDITDFLCISCLAENFDCSIDDLKVKIEEFKEAGCTLFK